MKKVLMVSCTLQLDHNDKRLILVPDEAGEAALAEIRSAHRTVEIPVEFEVADVAEAPIEATEENTAPDAPSDEEKAVNDEVKAALIPDPAATPR